MPKKSLYKGKRGELEFRKLCQSYGLKVVNQAEDKNKPDVRVGDLDVEVKRGQHIPIKVYQWLEEKNADVLVMRRDKKSWIAVMKYPLFFQLMGK